LEVSSNSNFETLQVNIRYKENQNSQPDYVHTLIELGLAQPRTVIAILKNYQIDGGAQSLSSKCCESKRSGCDQIGM